MKEKLTTSTVNGTILRVEEASKHIGCNGCTKQTVKIVAANKGICQSCKLQQLPSTCPVHWTVRILVKPKSGSKKLHLRLAGMLTQSLLQVINPGFQLKTAVEDAIVQMLLENY